MRCDVFFPEIRLNSSYILLDIQIEIKIKMYYQEASENSDDIWEPEEKLQDLENSLEAGNEDSMKIRIMANSFLMDLFRNALAVPEQMTRIHGVMRSLSEHSDPALRSTLMKMIPRLAYLCCNADRLDLVNDHLWPLLLSCLPDKDNEVRKTSEKALLILVKRKYVTQKEVEDVCPLVVQISRAHGHPSTVALMRKMAPLIGREATEKHFLDRFVCLCSDERPVVREMCAKSLGDMCTVLGTETTEKLLLPLFVQLSRDKCRNVRLSCVKVSVSVSCSCSPATRKSVLTAVFTRLLMDPEECVQVNAFGFLGAFICTFADPSVTRLDYDENGELIFLGQDGYEFRMQSAHINCSSDIESMENISDDFLFFEENCSGRSSLPRLNLNQRLFKIYEQLLPGMPWTIPENESRGTDPDAADPEKPDDSFNTFRFWRTPLPQLDCFDLESEHAEIRNNLNLLDNELSFLSEKLADCSPAGLEEIRTESVISSSSSPDSGWNSAETTPHVEPDVALDTKIGDGLPKCSDSKAESAADAAPPGQEIVPQLLLDCFVSMTVPMQDQSMEQEIAQDCAYSLPAVALTLGPTNWSHIKNAYKCLSMNIQWRVRRTVVSSIHKLASILGEEIASKDLAPIFECFIRDLDRVKIEALEHLADFLRLVKPETRNSFLPLLKEFLETDYDWNWRYREEFAQQLRLLLDLFSPADSLEYLEPLATLLLCDKVAAVRHKAVLLYLDLLVSLSRVPEFQEKLLYVLLKKFAEHSSWRRRQVFVLVCSEIARQAAFGSEDFGALLLDHLATLAKDPVANVGLGVARCLSVDVISTGYIGSSSPSYSVVLGILEKLKTHSDSDVRYFASLHDEVKNANDDFSAPILEAVKLET